MEIKYKYPFFILLQLIKYYQSYVKKQKLVNDYLKKKANTKSHLPL